MVIILELAILQAVHTSSRINNMLKWANIIEPGASNLELDSFDDAWYTEYKGTT